MAAGVGLVILLAVLFFRKDAPSTSPVTDGPRAVTPTPRRNGLATPSPPRSSLCARLPSRPRLHPNSRPASLDPVSCRRGRLAPVPSPDSSPPFRGGE